MAKKRVWLETVEHVLSHKHLNLNAKNFECRKTRSGGLYFNLNQTILKLDNESI